MATELSDTKPQSAERDPLDLTAEALNAITDNVGAWGDAYTAGYAQSVIVDYVSRARDERDALRERVQSLSALVDKQTHSMSMLTERAHATTLRLEERVLVLTVALTRAMSLMEADLSDTTGPIMRAMAEQARAALRGQS